MPSPRSPAPPLRPASRRWRQCGATLIELAIVAGLVAVLLALVLPLYRGWQDRVKTNQAQDDIIAMSMVIDAFHQDYGRFPADLAEIRRGSVRDPWGNAYQYLDLTVTAAKGKARKDHSLVPLNTDYDLYSKGPDGSSAGALTAKASRDDILRANNGRFVGPADRY